MSLKFSEIHAAIKTKMDTLTGFKQARYPLQYFGRTSNPLAHLGYSISLSSTNNGGRQRVTNAGVAMITTASVLFAYRLRPTDAYPTDYNLALDKEELVIIALLGSYSSIEPEMQINYSSSSREIPESLEYSMHTLEFEVIHYIK